ncbi:MAG: gas vesicle protein [Acidobacteriota bacterium]
MPIRRPRQSTVPAARPRQRASTPPPPKTSRPSFVRPPVAPPARRREVARIIDQSETSLVDVIDNLLNRGVVLNADLILALADVDLVYVRLSALLCAADRVLPPVAR